MTKGQTYQCSKCGNSIEVVHVGGGQLVCCNVPMDKVVAELPKSAAQSKGGLDPHVLLGVHITNRVKHASNVQNVLTDFGCNIKTRLGLHEVHGDACSPNGLMILEFAGTDAQCDDLSQRLTGLEGVEVKRMVFGHP